MMGKCAVEIVADQAAAEKTVEVDKPPSQATVTEAQPIHPYGDQAQQDVPAEPEPPAPTPAPAPPSPSKPDAKAKAPAPNATKPETPAAKPKPKTTPTAAAKAKKPALPEVPAMHQGSKTPKDFRINRYEVDLSTYSVKHEVIRCADIEDVLGGAARGFKLLSDYDVEDAYAVDSPLIMNLGCLSGSQFMTGLRTYFHGYSPLKASLADKPSAMWTAGSGKFGTKLRHMEIDEVVFSGRAVVPIYLHLTFDEEAGHAQFSFKNAEHLAGDGANEKIQNLYGQYPDAHFAVIGPAGENYVNVRYAAIALSTMNQLKSGDNKSRFCGRGGFGGIMGSKNLLAIVADGKDRKKGDKVEGLKELNQIVARGEGSRRFRDARKGDGGGGTWSNMNALDPLNAMPEFNFNPSGTEESKALWRDDVEKGDQYLVKDEACFACGIACHKNLYDNENGKPGKFHAKFDYEPLNLLSSNIGIYDIGQAAHLIELVDDSCMDSISIGVTLAYAMEYNQRKAASGEKSLLPNYIQYGNFDGARRAIEEIGSGKLPLLGQGSKRLSEALGETSYAMHCKGVEFPAYMPHVNPGYPWALAGGHMSMRTYLLYVFEKETTIDYWVDAITNRGPVIIRDDMIGVCKFSAMTDEHMAMAISAMSDLNIDADGIRKATMRTFLRGYRLEKKQGFGSQDYAMPTESLKPQDQLTLPHFNTPEFFSELKDKVLGTFDDMLMAEGL